MNLKKKIEILKISHLFTRNNTILIYIGNSTYGETIIYGETAYVIVMSQYNCEFLVYVDNKPYTVNVTEYMGTNLGYFALDNLTAGSHYANVTSMDSNYTAFNSTTFNITPKYIDVSLTVENIIYGNNAIVNVTSEIDGAYLVYVDNKPYTVNVINGTGSIPISDLNVGNHIANVTITNGNYTAFNSTTFRVLTKQNDVIIYIGNSTYGENITYGDTAYVIVLSEYNGIFMVYVDNTSYIVNVTENVGYFTLDNLTAGSHYANVTNMDGNY